jgi:hypothetical protein
MFISDKINDGEIDEFNEWKRKSSTYCTLFAIVNSIVESIIAKASAKTRQSPFS